MHVGSNAEIILLAHRPVHLYRCNCNLCKLQDQKLLLSVKTFILIDILLGAVSFTPPNLKVILHNAFVESVLTRGVPL